MEAIHVQIPENQNPLADLMMVEIGSPPRLMELRFFLLDFPRLSINQPYLPKTYIGVEGNVSSSSDLVHKLFEVFKDVMDLKDTYASKNVLITPHIVIFPKNDEYRQIAIAFSILSPPKHKDIETIKGHFRNFCQYSLKKRSIERICKFYVSGSQHQSLPNFSLDASVLFSKIAPSTIHDITVTDIIALMDRLKSLQPRALPLPRWSKINGELLLGLNGENNLLYCKKYNTVALIGQYDDIIIQLLHTPFIAHNSVIFTFKPDKYRQLIKESADLVSERKLQVVSPRNFGINLLEMMIQDKPFGIQLFRAWALLAEYPPSMDTLVQVLEWIAMGMNSDPIPNWLFLMEHREYFDSLDMNENQIESFLISMEDILGLKCLSNTEDRIFQRGGTIVVDCSLLNTKKQALALGLAFHFLRKYKYHDYSLAIAGWETFKTRHSLGHLQTLLSFSEFSQFPTLFLCENVVSGLMNHTQLKIIKGDNRAMSERKSISLLHKWMDLSKDAIVDSVDNLPTIWKLGSSFASVLRYSLLPFQKLPVWNLEKIIDYDELDHGLEEIHYPTADEEPETLSLEDFGTLFDEWLISWFSIEYQIETTRELYLLLNEHDVYSESTLSMIIDEMVSKDMLLLNNGNISVVHEVRQKINNVEEYLLSSQHNFSKLGRPLSFQIINELRDKNEQVSSFDDLITLLIESYGLLIAQSKFDFQIIKLKVLLFFALEAKQSKYSNDIWLNILSAKFLEIVSELDNNLNDDHLNAIKSIHETNHVEINSEEILKQDLNEGNPTELANSDAIPMSPEEQMGKTEELLTMNDLKDSLQASSSAMINSVENQNSTFLAGTKLGTQLIKADKTLISGDKNNELLEKTNDEERQLSKIRMQH